MTNSRHFRWSALGSQPTIDNWAGILQTYKNFNFDVQHWGHNMDPAWEKLWQRQGEALLERPPFPPKLFHYCRYGVPVNLRRDIWTKTIVLSRCHARPILSDIKQGLLEVDWLTDDVFELIKSF